MADTKRWTQPGWDGPAGTKSKKHQQRDRTPVRYKVRHQFVNGVKNCRFNLLRKIDELKLQEALKIGEEVVTG